MIEDAIGRYSVAAQPQKAVVYVAMQQFRDGGQKETQNHVCDDGSLLDKQLFTRGAAMIGPAAGAPVIDHARPAHTGP